MALKEMAQQGFRGHRRQRLSLQLDTYIVPCSHTQPKPQRHKHQMDGGRGRWGTRLVRGGPLTSDGGAFCKGNRETQVSAKGEGARGQEPCLPLCRAVEPQPAF